MTRLVRKYGWNAGLVVLLAVLFLLARLVQPNYGASGVSWVGQQDRRVDAVVAWDNLCDPTAPSRSTSVTRWAYLPPSTSISGSPSARRNRNPSSLCKVRCGDRRRAARRSGR